jgi:hypothetical protein
MNDETSAEAFIHQGPIETTKLRGPSSQLLTLPRVVFPAAYVPGVGPVTIQWLPEDRRALELELRCEIVSSTAGTAANLPDPTAIGDQPLIYYRLEIGHGKAVYTRPSGPTKAVSTTHEQDYVLPIRGLYLRLSTRELKLTLYSPGVFNIPPMPVTHPTPCKQSVVRVSFQPVLDSGSAPTFPRGDAHFAPSAAYAPGVKQFPMEANEWRVRKLNGLPFAAGVTSLVFVGLNGGALALGGLTDAASFADWTPIPTLARSFTNGLATVPMQIDYR